jgi:hypothetical protein
MTTGHFERLGGKISICWFSDARSLPKRRFWLLAKLRPAVGDGTTHEITPINTKKTGVFFVTFRVIS